jgi:hypothetical protein
LEHAQVIGCDIKLGSVDKSRDVENGTISFFLNEKMRLFPINSKGISYGLIFKPPPYFFWR